MLYKATSAVSKIRAMTKRLRVVQGGSSAGKTIAILLILIDKAQREKGILISVVSETVPHLKRGAIRDFLNIMEGHHYYKDDLWNRTDFIYSFETGSKMEFFSAENSDKVRGPRRDVLFLNEANNLSYDTYTQLAIRTNGDIYIDFNPVMEFWVHTDLIPKLEHDFIILTYKDNEGLSESIIKEIESRKDNKYFWTVYGMGQLGELEGRIYSGWNIIDEIPHEARLERYGLDFGYTNDPTAIVAVYKYNNGYILDEVCYTKGMSNKDIVDTLKTLPQALVIADSAEPKSIDEIKAYGINIQPAIKGTGSVNTGIQFVQDQAISVTKHSVNLIKEYRNYMWIKDKDGRVINEPMDMWNHLLDALRYALSSFRPLNDSVLGVQTQRFQRNMNRADLRSAR